MNTLQSIADSLNHARQGATDVDLSSKTGLTRQSVGRALSGQQNFNVTSLLAIAEALDMEVVIVPKGTARALAGTTNPLAPHVTTMTDQLRKL